MGEELREISTLYAHTNTPRTGEQDGGGFAQKIRKNHLSLRTIITVGFFLNNNNIILTIMSRGSSITLY